MRSTSSRWIDGVLSALGLAALTAWLYLTIGLGWPTAHAQAFNPTGPSGSQKVFVVQTNGRGQWAQLVFDPSDAGANGVGPHGPIYAVQVAGSDGAVLWVLRVDAGGAARVNVVSSQPLMPLNPLLPRCNAVQRTLCQP